MTLANIAEDVPTGTRTDATRAFTCGAGHGRRRARGGAFDDGNDGVECTPAYPVARDLADSTIGFRCCSNP